MNNNNIPKNAPRLLLFALMILSAQSCLDFQFGPPLPPSPPPPSGPLISLDNRVGYISTDTTVNAGAVVTIGVRTQTRKNDETLTSLSELVRYDGTGDSIIQTITIPTSSSQTYDKDFTINTRKVPGYETYSFKIQDQAHENAVISLSIVTR